MGVTMGVVTLSVAGADVVDVEFCVLVRPMKDFCGGI